MSSRLLHDPQGNWKVLILNLFQVYHLLLSMTDNRPLELRGWGD